MPDYVETLQNLFHKQYSLITNMKNFMDVKIASKIKEVEAKINSSKQIRKGGVSPTIRISLNNNQPDIRSVNEPELMQVIEDNSEAHNKELADKELADKEQAFYR